MPSSVFFFFLPTHPADINRLPPLTQLSIITSFSEKKNVSLCGLELKGNEKRQNEKNTWRVCFSYQQKDAPSLHLPTYRLANRLHPIRNLVHKIKCGRRRCGEKKSYCRGRKGDTEGGEKVRDTGGFIALPEIRRVSTQMVGQTKPRRRSEINQPLHHWHIFTGTTVDF